MDKLGKVNRIMNTARSMGLTIGFSILLAPLVSGCGNKGEPLPKEKAETTERAEKSQNPSGQIALSPEILKNVRFKSLPVTSSTITEAIQVTAAIVANQDRVFHVTPRIRGRVMDVYVSVGSRVDKGTSLALLDSTELGEIKAEYVKAKTLLGLARASYDREKRLFEQKIAAQKDALAAEADYRKAEAEVQLLSEKLRLYGLSEEEIASLGNSLSPSRYNLRSPAPGIVTEKDVTLGEVLEAGKKIFVISNLSTVWIHLDIQERDLPKIRVGQRVTVSVAAYPEKQFIGKVTYLSDVMDEKTRTIRARVEVVNPVGLLKPGMFAEARIETGAGSEMKMTVPKEAVFLLDDGPVVFIEKETGFFIRRVESGKEVGGRVEILNGISEGEKVVVEGGYYLKAEILKSQMGAD